MYRACINKCIGDETFAASTFPNEGFVILICFKGAASLTHVHTSQRQTATIEKTFKRNTLEIETKHF